MGSIYSVGLTGESNYQPAIKRAKTGETVTLRLEPFNRHDNEAIAVENRFGETIGYIPADSFIKRIVHLEKKPLACHVERIGKGSAGIYGVILQIELSADNPTPIYTGEKPAPKKRSNPAPKKSKKNASSSILKGLLKMFR